MGLQSSTCSLSLSYAMCTYNIQAPLRVTLKAYAKLYYEALKINRCPKALEIQIESNMKEWRKKTQQNRHRIGGQFYKIHRIPFRRSKNTSSQLVVLKYPNFRLRFFDLASFNLKSSYFSNTSCSQYLESAQMHLIKSAQSEEVITGTNYINGTSRKDQGKKRHYLCHECYNSRKKKFVYKKKTSFFFCQADYNRSKTIN